MLTTRASGRRPSDRAGPASTSTTALAPSLMPELLPAVTDAAFAEGRPQPRQRFEARVGARVLVAIDTTSASPFGCGTVTGTISSSKQPPIGDRRDGALLTAQREGVLLLAA